MSVSSIALLALVLCSHHAFSQANNIVPPRDIGSLGDVSWGYLEFEVRGQPNIGELFPILPDTEIALYDSRGKVLLENDNINFFLGNFNSRITWKNPVAGQYYLAVGLKNTEFKEQFLVTTTSTSSGRYLLTTSRENTPPGNPTFNPIMPGTVPARGVVFYKFIITDRLNDLDGDGIFNSVEDQYDCLDKNVADADKDPDRDGLSNIAELNLGTDPCNPDSDFDGLTDGEEVNRIVSGQPASTNPRDDDTDGDGLSDGFETGTGIVNGMTDSGTDPLLADTDGDAVGDLKELQIGTDPFNPDTDGDGSADGVEIASQTDPLDGIRPSDQQAKLIDIEYKSQGLISMTWRTTASVDYQLQKSRDLKKWENVETTGIANSDVFTYSQPSTGEREFFRLKSVPVPYLDGKSPLHALSLGSVPAGKLYIDTWGSAVIDTVMACYDSNGNYLFWNDDSSETIRWSVIGATFLPGTYYIATGKFPFLGLNRSKPFNITGTTGVTDGITVNVFGENIEAGILQSASGVNSSGALWFSIVVE